MLEGLEFAPCLDDMDGEPSLDACDGLEVTVSRYDRGAYRLPEELCVGKPYVPLMLLIVGNGWFCLFGIHGGRLLKSLLLFLPIYDFITLA